MPDPRPDGVVRCAVVLEVLGHGGRPPFVVRWDDHHESVIYPSVTVLVAQP